MFRGEPSLARSHFEESLHAARRANYGSLSATRLVGLGSAELSQGDYPAAEAHLHEGSAVAAACSDTHTEVVVGTWLAELAELRGRPDEAGRRFKECLEGARAIGAPYALARSLLGLGRSMLEQGDPQGAQPLFDETAQVAQRAGLAHLVARALIGRGQAALAHGDLRGGCADLDDALLLARRRGDKVGEALALEGFGRLGRLEGDVQAAASRARQALILQAQIDDPAATANCLELLASLVAAEECRLAARLLGAAESLRARHGCVRTASHAQEQCAAVEAARRVLGDETFGAEWARGRTMSAPAAVAYADRHRARRVPRPAKGWEALTRSERTVAELAAEGRTNAEIARQLQIAAPTVKAHLRRVFAKLGLQTRASLAAEVYRRREP